MLVRTDLLVIGLLDPLRLAWPSPAPELPMTVSTGYGCPRMKDAKAVLVNRSLEDCEPVLEDSE